MIYHYQSWAKRDYIMGCIYFCLNDYRTHMGEEGVGRFKARVHGISDLYLKKKPSYYVFKQLASPIEIISVKKVSDRKIIVELRNKNSLPTYTISGYKLEWKSVTGAQKEQALPLMKPGDQVKVELNDMGDRCLFDLIAPAGYKVTGYPVVQ
jgi:beta-glucuronidase